MTRTDFVSDFMLWTEGLPSPELFRLWSGVTCVAGALERRTWVESARGVLYPNLYTMLVAPPGVGKDQSIDPVEMLWGETKGLHLSPDSMTAASMLDAFSDSKRAILSKDGKIQTEFHGLLIAASEFVVFCPAYDLEFLGRLTKIYDCRPNIRVRRKYIKEEVNIVRPYLTMLTGAQPGILKSLFPDEAWSGGFTSRLLMVYAGEGPRPELFGEVPLRADLHERLRKHLATLSRLYGRFYLETDAAIRLNNWHMAGGPPRPSHPKLMHYSTRRSAHVLKLCMIASASRGFDLRITEDDVDRAMEWLFRAEEVMPEIFKAMHGKSDGDIIRDLHFVMWSSWSKHKRPIHKADIIKYLTDRVPHEKIMRIIEIAELSHVIKSVGPGLYEPLAQIGTVGID